MQQEMSHQMMGYDRASTMFAPDGRLLQVEYAKEAVKQGSTAIGMVCSDGVLIVTDKRISDKFVISSSVEKIFKVDKHIAATAVGYVMDGRVLIEKSQVMAQQHNITYDTPIELPTLVKEVADLKQAYTQFGGARPFGVSIMFAGVDDGPSLYVTDPTGIYFQFRATAVGEGEADVKAILEKEYKEEMTLEEGLKLAVKALKLVLGKEFDIRRVDAAYINKTNKNFTRVDRKKLR